MSDGETFAKFLRRIRAGDTEAVSEFIRKYEPEIRMEAKLRMRDPRLHRVIDSMDICQSVLASFFIKAASGGYDLETPERLLALLMTIARRKVAYHARRQKAQMRDQHREEPLTRATPEPLAPDPSPSRLFAGASCSMSSASDSRKRSEPWQI